MDPLASYPVVIEIPVQWGDMDALRHVNNVVFFRWWESSRLAFCSEVGLLRGTMNTDAPGTVLANMTCDFRQQLVYPDTVKIGARPGPIGNKSIRIEHCLVSQTTGQVAAEAVSTIVMFDFQKQESVLVEDAIRERFQAMTREVS